MQTKIILELGCNHQGDVQLAAQMIEDAASLGVHGVKLQLRDVESIPKEQRDLPRDLSNSFGETYYTHRAALELDADELIYLKELAEGHGLVFMVSVFDLISAQRAVEEYKIKYIKLPSQFYLDSNLNTYLALNRGEHRLFLARSTGMHTVSEVFNSLGAFKFDMTLYCRSIYPHSLGEANIAFAKLLYSRLPAERRGYSSHDKDGELIPLMIALGASWIERHYTLDKNLKGSDHHTVSSDYNDMTRILRDVNEIERALTLCDIDTLDSANERAAAEFYRRK